ncbi:YveK family protein [Thermophilibacter sp.]
MTLLELLALLRKHLRLVVALPVACALVMGVYSLLFMPDTYTATTSMYVLASAQDGGSSSSLSSDLSASQMVANDVATLLQSDRALSETASDLGLQSLSDYDVSVTSETTSRVITLTVTGPDAQTAADAANAMVSNVSAIAQEVMSVESVNPIDQAQAPTAPSGPNRALYVAVALMAGLFAAVAVVVVADMLNTRVRGQEEVEELLGIPVIGRVPAMRGGM